VSYGIIKNHKGTITVESAAGVGTTFTIELPIYKAEEERNNEQLQNYGN
jgi:two-component system NtrC family sensor kinase